jgi:glycosyltransferase involved in cell wall biosynthesis
VKLGIVIPALNEAGAIGDILGQLQTRLRDLTVAIVVIDGGSSDNTVRIVKSLGIEVIRQSREGYGDALSIGFEYVSKQLQSEIIVMLDSDRRYDPRDDSMIEARGVI